MTALEDFIREIVQDDIHRRRMLVMGKHEFQESSVSAEIAQMLDQKGIDHEFTDQEIQGIIKSYSPTKKHVQALIDWVRRMIREGREPSVIR